MRKVYFDTNVYTHIVTRDYGITTGDVVRLISKIKGFKLRIYGAADELQAAEQRGHDSAADAEHKGGVEAAFEEEV
jgi:hypothetical protein